MRSATQPARRASRPPTGTEYSNLGNANTGTNSTDNTFLYADDLTWLQGRHTFKFGAQFMRQQQNNFYPGNDGSNGGFYFLGAGTSGPGQPSTSYANTGYAADLPACDPGAMRTSCRTTGSLRQT